MKVVNKVGSVSESRGRNPGDPRLYFSFLILKIGTTLPRRAVKNGPGSAHVKENCHNCRCMCTFSEGREPL